MTELLKYRNKAPHCGRTAAVITAKHFIIRGVFDSPPQNRKVDCAPESESYPAGNYLRKYSEEREREACSEFDVLLWCKQTTDFKRRLFSVFQHPFLFFFNSPVLFKQMWLWK